MRASGQRAAASRAARAPAVAASSRGGNKATSVAGACETPSNTAPSDSNSAPTSLRTSYAVRPSIAVATAANTGGPGTRWWTSAVPQNAQKAASGCECRPHAGHAGDLVAGSSIRAPAYGVPTSLLIRDGSLDHQLVGHRRGFDRGRAESQREVVGVRSDDARVLLGHDPASHELEQGLVERLHAVVAALGDHVGQPGRLFGVEDPLVDATGVEEHLDRGYPAEPVRALQEPLRHDATQGAR